MVLIWNKSLTVKAWLGYWFGLGWSKQNLCRLITTSFCQFLSPSGRLSLLCCPIPYTELRFPGLRPRFIIELVGGYNELRESRVAEFWWMLLNGVRVMADLLLQTRRNKKRLKNQLFLGLTLVFWSRWKLQDSSVAYPWIRSGLERWTTKLLRLAWGAWTYD